MEDPEVGYHFVKLLFFFPEGRGGRIAGKKEILKKLYTGKTCQSPKVINLGN
jgi:hypothetical protein